MRRFFLLAPLALAIGGCAGTPSFQPQRADPANAERQILLTVPQDAAAIALTGPPGKRYLRRRGYRASPTVDRTLDQIAMEHELQRVEGWPIRSLGVYCEVLEVADSESVEAIIQQLSSDPRVDLVQRMNIFETLASRYDDPYGEMQSAVLDLGVEQAHSLATGRGVTVAVIDSAVDTAHPDLAGRVTLSRDLVDTPRAPARGEVHGTAVAGVIGSLVNNSEGIIGVAPDVDIAALRACWPAANDPGGAHCSSFTLAQALEAAIEVEPQIINLSLAGPFDPLLSRLLDKAIERGAVIVTAHPEAGEQATEFPASHPLVIVAHSPTVSANSSSRYTLPAPANEILTTTPNSGYGFLSGSSLAAAHVSGVIALLMERDPSIDTESVVSLLTSTSVFSGTRTTINACRALETLVDADVCGTQTLQF